MAARAFYPGSFDPITWGHVDLIDRGLKIFNDLWVVIGQSPSHKKPLFSTKERVEMLEEVLKDRKGVRIETHEGLMMDYAKSSKMDVMIRGLRVASDFDYEFMMTAMNRELNPEVETVFLCSDKELLFVSSTMMKEVASYGGDIGHYVPPLVEKRLKEKLKKEASP